MNASNFTTHPYVSPIHTYGDNLGRAARGLVAALLAIEPDTLQQEAANMQTDGVVELNDLANQFDNIMPSQAAELRYLAGTAEEDEAA